MKKAYSFGIIPLRLKNLEWQILLVQLHAGHWSFPKGHAEKEESAIQTAERELFEETGLFVESYLNDKLYQEDYFFKQGTTLIKKKVGYFAAIVKGKVTLQTEEIKNYQWLNVVDTLNQLSFSKNKEMVQELSQLLPGKSSLSFFKE